MNKSEMEHQRNEKFGNGTNCKIIKLLLLLLVVVVVLVVVISSLL